MIRSDVDGEARRDSLRCSLNHDSCCIDTAPWIRKPNEEIVTQISRGASEEGWLKILKEELGHKLGSSAYQRGM